ncbi:MAG: hypothetical protein ACXVA9_11465 [Bdellovibrionales bacterium]
MKLRIYTTFLFLYPIVAIAGSQANPISDLNNNQAHEKLWPTRPPTDEEFKFATKFAAKKKADVQVIDVGTSDKVCLMLVDALVRKADPDGEGTDVHWRLFAKSAKFDWKEVGAFEGSVEFSNDYDGDQIPEIRRGYSKYHELIKVYDKRLGVVQKVLYNNEEDGGDSK